MPTIKDIEAIEELVNTGYINKKIHPSGDLAIYNYAPKTQFEGNWNPATLICRGLILNVHTHEVVALPFPKFFNWLQMGRKTDSPIKEIYEKMDGSLGILFRHDGKHHIATRGSFTSEQAIWATQFLNDNYDLSQLPENYTLLFEIIYPDNRIVVDYGDRKDLVLLGVRDRFNGSDLTYAQFASIGDFFGFSLPEVFSFDSMESIRKASMNIPANQEGWVVRFKSGERFKVKGKEYLVAHYMKHEVTYKKVLEAIWDGTLDRIIESVPDEFLLRVNNYRDYIETEKAKIEDGIKEAMANAPEQGFDEDFKAFRKRFAQWVMQEHKHVSKYLFAMRDEKPIDSMIYDDLADRKNIDVEERLQGAD